MTEAGPVGRPSSSPASHHRHSGPSCPQSFPGTKPPLHLFRWVLPHSLSSVEGPQGPRGKGWGQCQLETPPWSRARAWAQWAHAPSSVFQPQRFRPVLQGVDLLRTCRLTLNQGTRPCQPLGARCGKSTAGVRPSFAQAKGCLDLVGPLREAQPHGPPRMLGTPDP